MQHPALALGKHTLDQRQIAIDLGTPALGRLRLSFGTEQLRTPVSRQNRPSDTGVRQELRNQEELQLQNPKDVARLDNREGSPMMTRLDPTFQASPKLAMEAPQENFVYTLLLSPDFSKPDALAVIDIKPASPTFSQIVHTVTGNRLPNRAKGHRAALYRSPDRSTCQRSARSLGNIGSATRNQHGSNLDPSGASAQRLKEE